MGYGDFGEYDVRIYFSWSSDCGDWPRIVAQKTLGSAKCSLCQKLTGVGGGGAFSITDPQHITSRHTPLHLWIGLLAGPEPYPPPPSLPLAPLPESRSQTRPVWMRSWTWRPSR